MLTTCIYLLVAAALAMQAQAQSSQSSCYIQSFGAHDSSFRQLCGSSWDQSYSFPQNLPQGPTNCYLLTESCSAGCTSTVYVEASFYYTDVFEVSAQSNGITRTLNSTGFWVEQTSSPMLISQNTTIPGTNSATYWNGSYTSNGYPTYVIPYDYYACPIGGESCNNYMTFDIQYHTDVVNNDISVCYSNYNTKEQSQYTKPCTTWVSSGYVGLQNKIVISFNENVPSQSLSYGCQVQPITNPWNPSSSLSTQDTTIQVQSVNLEVTYYCGSSSNDIMQKNISLPGFNFFIPGSNTNNNLWFPSQVETLSDEAVELQIINYDTGLYNWCSGQTITITGMTDTLELFSTTADYWISRQSYAVGSSCKTPVSNGCFSFGTQDFFPCTVGTCSEIVPIPFQLTRQCASGTGDPVFNGFHGQVYQVHGLPGSVFNLISSTGMQLNARFIFLDSDSDVLNGGEQAEMQMRSIPKTKALAALHTSNGNVSVPLPVTAAWTHDGTYLGEMTLRLRTSSKVHRIYLSPGRFFHGIAEIIVNNLAIAPTSALMQSLVLLEEENVKVVLESTHSIFVSTAEMSFSLVNSDGFFNLDGASLTQLTRQKPELLQGLIGQSADATTYFPHFELTKNAASDIKSDWQQHMILDYLVGASEEELWSDDFVKDLFSASEHLS